MSGSNSQNSDESTHYDATLILQDDKMTFSYCAV